jgi:hypothetical protein
MALNPRWIHIPDTHTLAFTEVANFDGPDGGYLDPDKRTRFVWSGYDSGLPSHEQLDDLARHLNATGYIPPFFEDEY